MSWQEALDDLRQTVSRATAKLEQSLANYETATQRSRQELDLLRSIDNELVKYAFDLDEVMVRIVNGVLRLTDASLCELLVLKGHEYLEAAWSSNRELIGSKVPLSNSVSGDAYLSGETIRVPDVRYCPKYFSADARTQSELAVPMKDESGGTLAVINLESADVNHFTERHEALTQTAAGQAALAFRNARLYREFISILETFSVVQSEAESLNAILAKIGEEARNLIGAEQCQVLTVFDDELVVQFTTGKEQVGTTRVKVQDSVTGLALRENRAVRYADVTTDPEACRFYQGILSGMKSELAVPIVWGTERLGVINLESPRSNAFSRHDEELLRLFSAQAALATFNARRVQELLWNQRIESELWALAQVGDVYGPLLHRLNSDAGLITAAVSEAKYKYATLLSTEANGDLRQILESIESKAEQILELPARFRKQLERAGDYEETDVLAVVKKIVDGLDVGPTICFVTELQQVPRIFCSPQVEEAIHNLVMNAVEALPDGGKVVIGTREWVTRPKLGRPARSGVEVYVADTCGGISEGRQRTMWEIGATEKRAAKRRHLGFGLWWVRAFAQRSGGGVEVESPVEVEGQEGCRFTLRLPEKCRRPSRLAEARNEQA
jgi:putative methionine-R-sulfoxide reductase with GAF domain